MQSGGGSGGANHPYKLSSFPQPIQLLTLGYVDWISGNNIYICILFSRHCKNTKGKLPGQEFHKAVP